MTEKLKKITHEVPTFRTHTLGCKVNIYESEAVNSELFQKGWEWAKSNEEADVHIFNTCTVTKMSDTKSRKLIRSTIRENPNAIIIVMGCYSQLNPEDILAIDGVDIVLGSEGRSKIPEYLNHYLEKGEKLKRITPVSDLHNYEELKVGRLTTHTRGFIKIQDGCENFCTYCRIPYARGPIRSRDEEAILSEIKNLVDEGVKEIILSGINTGTYGQDLKTITLANLVDTLLSRIPSLMRIRLSSIELMEVSDELINLFEKYPTRLARHLHIPLQAGSNTVLKRMGRKYTTEEYYTKVHFIQEKFPGIAITTDCLAGFVGETEVEFQEAKSFIQKMKFANLHIFPYSRRKETKADQMEGHLPKELIEKRTKILLGVAKELKANFLRSMVGSNQLVLMEQKNGGAWMGHSSNYLEVAIPSNENYLNKMIDVEITKTDGNICIGRVRKVVG